MAAFVRLEFVLRKVFLKDFRRWVQQRADKKFGDYATPAAVVGSLIESELAQLRLEKNLARKKEIIFGERLTVAKCRKIKLTPEAVQRLLHLAAHHNHSELARRFGISGTSVRRILATRAANPSKVSPWREKQKPKLESRVTI